MRNLLACFSFLLPRPHSFRCPFTRHLTCTLFLLSGLAALGLLVITHNRDIDILRISARRCIRIRRRRHIKFLDFRFNRRRYPCKRIFLLPLGYNTRRIRIHLRHRILPAVTSARLALRHQAFGIHVLSAVGYLIRLLARKHIFSNSLCFRIDINAFSVPAARIAALVDKLLKGFFCRRFVEDRLHRLRFVRRSACFVDEFHVPFFTRKSCKARSQSAGFAEVKIGLLVVVMLGRIDVLRYFLARRFGLWIQ